MSHWKLWGFDIFLHPKDPISSPCFDDPRMDTANTMELDKHLFMKKDPLKEELCPLSMPVTRTEVCR